MADASSHTADVDPKSRGRTLRRVNTKYPEHTRRRHRDCSEQGRAKLETKVCPYCRPSLAIRVHKAREAKGEVAGAMKSLRRGDRAKSGAAAGAKIAE